MFVALALAFALFLFLCLFPPTARAGTICRARDFDVAGDGVRDDTTALQKALDVCGEKGGVVQLEPRAYAIQGRLTVPRGVTLEGVLTGPPLWGRPSFDYGLERGTVLLAHDGRGREEGPPFLTLSANATLRGLTVYYPEQRGGDVVPYPWCIGSGGGDNITITDCVLVNPYQAVDFGSRNSSRHVIRRLYGSPLRRGVFIDNCTDVGRIEFVHFWPFYQEAAREAKVRAFIQEQGEAFIFGRTDWQQVYNTFCWGYGTGYRFVNTPLGVCNGNFIGIGADAANICVKIENCAPYALQMSNGQFVAIFGERPTSVVVDATNSGTVQFNNCSFWGHCHQNARIAGKGYVSFNQCHFIEWDREGKGVPCIDVQSGLASITASRFVRPGEAVRIGESVKGAVVTGNLLGSDGAVQVQPGARATVEANLAARPPYATPAGSRVISVLGPHVSVVGEWANISGRGTFTDFSYVARGGDGSAKFRWKLDSTGDLPYTLSAWVPDDPSPSHALRQRYTVHHAAGETVVEVNQGTARGGWVPLGRFLLDEHSVVVLDNRAEGYVVADALLLSGST